MKVVTVWKKDVGYPPVRIMTIDSLKNWQEQVGGHIEAVQITSDLLIICNEEGRINKMKFNCNIGGYDFYGPILFVGVDGEEFADCPADEKTFKRMFRKLFESEKESK